MRFVSNFPPPVVDVGGDEVKGVAGIRPVRPERIRSHPSVGVEQYKLDEPPQPQQPPPVGGQNEPGRRTVFPEERRKVSLRVRRQPVLVELRSGIDRRRRNLRAGDIVEHIDEKV
ncbi:MAG: hypothetical protein EPN14_05130 [Gallionella sp.]|nr:MAG: hypothetical protein EPN14_05130 [Gallionella sp.]